MNIKNKRISNDEEVESSTTPLEYYESPAADGGMIYTVFIDEGVRAASYYRLITLMLSQASEEDLVIFRINSPGGDLEAGVALVSAIRKCKAPTHAVITGECISAATIIAFACDTIEVGEYSAFMIHTFSAVMGGTANNLLASTNYHYNRIEAVYRDLFQAFLTEEEFDTVLNKGVDLYFTAEQVIDRLQE